MTSRTTRFARFAIALAATCAVAHVAHAQAVNKASAESNVGLAEVAQAAGGNTIFKAYSTFTDSKNKTIENAEHKVTLTSNGAVVAVDQALARETDRESIMIARKKAPTLKAGPPVVQFKDDKARIKILDDTETLTSESGLNSNPTVGPRASSGRTG